MSFQLTRLFSVTLLAVLLSSAAALSVQTPAIERFVLIEIGEKVGDLEVKTSGKRVDVDWKVNDNGRGPKIKERIDLDEAGVPVHWQIEGTAGIGAPVKETFDYSGGRAKWKSLDDSGEAASRSPLYSPNNG